MATINKAQNKEFINEVATIYANCNGTRKFNQKDFDFMRKDNVCVMKTSDGLLIPFEKLRIETSFCTGYGYGLDYDDARDMAQMKRTSQGYFKQSNLEGVERNIKIAKESEKLYIMTQYCFGGAISYVLNERHFWNFPCDKERIIREMTPAEKDEYIAHFEFQKEDLSKRIDSYLKRYGMSKVRSWTYDVND